MHRILLPALYLIVLIISLAPGMSAQAQGRRRCFSETGYCIEGPILDYWERNGGGPVFGYPITRQRSELVENRELLVQWFERDRLEIQPDGQVTAGRLSVHLLELHGPPWHTLPQVDHAPPDCVFFAETRHALCEPFLSYWQQNGGLERFGYPLSEPRTATIREGTRWRGTVQWFERRRMEHHTELPGQPILLGLLGRSFLLELGATPPPAAQLASDDMLPIAAVSAGTRHNCVLHSAGSVACWGDNRLAQSNAPDGSFTQVTVGQTHSCGLHTDGTVECWGFNEQATPSAYRFVQIDSKWDHTCGVRSDGSIACWGNNEYGKATPPSGSFSQVSAGEDYTCALSVSGQEYCWGQAYRAPLFPELGR